MIFLTQMAVGLLFRDKIKIKHSETPYINLHYLKNEERLCPREEDILCLTDLDTIRRSTSTSVDLYMGSRCVFS